MKQLTEDQIKEINNYCLEKGKPLWYRNCLLTLAQGNNDISHIQINEDINKKIEQRAKAAYFNCLMEFNNAYKKLGIKSNIKTKIFFPLDEKQEIRYLVYETAEKI